jgi:hypothetical protein
MMLLHDFPLQKEIELMSGSNLYMKTYEIDNGISRISVDTTIFESFLNFTAHKQASTL